MSHLVVLALALVGALVQVGVLPVLEADPLARPLLPVALIAGWCAMRGPAATWPVLLVMPLVAGPLSDERTGWYLLALLPAAALGVALGLPPDAKRVPAWQRLSIAALIAIAGTAAHAAVLAFAARAPIEPLAAAAAVSGAAAWTMLFAVALAAALWPLRPRARGLFA